MAKDTAEILRETAEAMLEKGMIVSAMYWLGVAMGLSDNNDEDNSQ